METLNFQFQDENEKFYCAECQCEITIDDYYSFDDRENHVMCYECYCQELERREQEEQSIIDNYNFHIDAIKEVLDDNEVTYFSKFANTGSTYFECSHPDIPIDFKIRLANHSQCYNADFNIALTDNNQDGMRIEFFKPCFENWLKKNIENEK